MANEGKLIGVVAPETVGSVLEAMRAHPLGRHAAIIGEVIAAHPGMVTMRSVVGGQPPPWDRLAIGGTLALLYLVLACMFFFAVYRSVIRNGLIARYSAETVI